jgi:hypothetical protein
MFEKWGVPELIGKHSPDVELRGALILRMPQSKA